MVRETATIFSIGYEGRSFEEYAELLVENDVRLVCDLRRNPISRKPGFSKTKFQNRLSELDIAYSHFRDLGIESKLRQNLKSDADREKLFRVYAKELPKKSESLVRIQELLAEYRRIALTCFERDPSQCHRQCVASYLENKVAMKVEYIHL